MMCNLYWPGIYINKLALGRNYWGDIDRNNMIAILLAVELKQLQALMYAHLNFSLVCIN